jgi:hypothetical protein
MDLVATCPKDFWLEWLAEGDCAGEKETGVEYSWFTRHSLAGQIKPGERFYIVCNGKLRGFSIVTRITGPNNGAYQICRKGGAVALTINEAIPGFRGLRRVWWLRDDEKPFPDWKTLKCE